MWFIVVPPRRCGDLFIINRSVFHSKWSNRPTICNKEYDTSSLTYNASYVVTIREIKVDITQLQMTEKRYTSMFNNKLSTIQYWVWLLFTVNHEWIMINSWLWLQKHTAHDDRIKLFSFRFSLFLKIGCVYRDNHQPPRDNRLICGQNCKITTKKCYY